MENKKTNKEKSPKEKGQKRQYLKQSHVPSCSISDALRVAKAIAENYGSKPTIPLKVAKALDLEPRASPFKMLTGASIAYGITEGGYNAEKIIITDLGKRMIKPLTEDDDLVAKRQGFLIPKVIKEFLTNYDGSPLPREDIAHNVLEEMSVPKDKLSSVLKFLIAEAKALGFVEEIKNKIYISLNDVANPIIDPTLEDDVEIPDQNHEENDESEDELEPKDSNPPVNEKENSRRVFITHGKNKKFVDPIKKLLGFGELKPVVSTEKQSVSQPVPEKVMEDMRSCGAAIIHVEDEVKLIDSEAKEVIVLNPNVLIEIGAAMALYGSRFILVVKDGVKLPSNLQGLYEVRYHGETLDGEATIKLLEAINDIKNHPTPFRKTTSLPK